MRRYVFALISTGLACTAAAFAPAQDSKPAEPAVRKQPAAPTKEAAKEPEEDKALAPLIQQYLPHLRPLFSSELHMVEVVCKTTKEQAKKLDDDGDAALREVAAEVAKAQQKMMQGLWNGGTNNPDARALLQANMLRIVAKHLSPDQKALYQAELDRRKASRRKAAIATIVAQMDIELILTAEQRDKIAAALDSQWDDAWAGAIETVMYGSNFLPNVPSRITDPCLSDTQKKVWKATARGQGIFINGLNLGGGMFGFDIDVDVPEVEKVAPPEEAKKAEAAPVEKTKP